MRERFSVFKDTRKCQTHYKTGGLGRGVGRDGRKEDWQQKKKSDQPQMVIGKMREWEQAHGSLDDECHLFQA